MNVCAIPEETTDLLIDVAGWRQIRHVLPLPADCGGLLLVRLLFPAVKEGLYHVVLGEFPFLANIIEPRKSLGSHRY